MSFKQLKEEKVNMIKKIWNKIKAIWESIVSKFWQNQILIALIRQGDNGRLLSPGTNYDNNTRRDNKVQNDSKEDYR